MIQWVNDMTSLKDLKSTSYSTHITDVVLLWISAEHLLALASTGQRSWKAKSQSVQPWKMQISDRYSTLTVVFFRLCLSFCSVKIIPLQTPPSEFWRCCCLCSPFCKSIASFWRAASRRFQVSRASVINPSKSPSLYPFFSISWLRVIVIRIHKVPSWWW